MSSIKDDNLFNECFTAAKRLTKECHELASQLMQTPNTPDAANAIHEKTTALDNKLDGLIACIDVVEGKQA